MRKNLGVNSYMYPMPVLIIAAYDKDGKPDAMNAAWGGICSDDKISMCLSPGHKTVKNILETGAFTVSFADAAHVAQCDYVGIVSGNNVPDKFAKSGFHAIDSEFVNAPLIEELPMALECRLASYDEETHCMIGQIVNVCADESIVTEDGGIDVERLAPIAYDPVNHYYHVLGDIVGNAFSDGEKLK